MSRLRKNFVTGTITSTLTSSGTTINLTPALGNFTVTAPDYLPLIINPNSYGGVTGTSEIVYVTAYTANSLSATISRGKESTTASGWSSGTVYSHGVLAADLPTDLPAPTASGQLLVSTSTTSGTWATSLPSGLTIANPTLTSPTISGGTISGATISGTTTNVGTLNGGTISGSSIYSTTLYSGTTIASGVSFGTSNAVSPIRTWTLVTGNTVAISGFTNYLVLANGYGASTTGFIVTTVSGSVNSGMTSPTQIAQAQAESTGHGATGLFLSVSDVGTIATSGPSAVYYTRVYNTGYTSGAGTAVVIGLN